MSSMPTDKEQHLLSDRSLFLYYSFYYSFKERESSMKILGFVQSLLPSIKKDRLEEDLDICIKDITNTVIPAYTPAANAMHDMHSSEAKEFERMWFSNVRDAKKGEFIKSVESKLKDCMPVLEYIQRMIDEQFESEIMAEGLTILKTTLLRIVEISGFASTYALRLLNYIYTLETKEITGKESNIAGSLTQGEINLIKTHFLEYCIAINSISRDVKKTEKTLKAIPDVLVSAKGKAAMAAFGDAKTDALGAFNVRGFSLNPIYHIGMVIAEFQANKYKRNKDLKSVLELRLLNLQQAKDGKPDAVTDKEIELLQSRIESLDEKIRKAEESVQ